LQKPRWVSLGQFHDIKRSIIKQGAFEGGEAFVSGSVGYIDYNYAGWKI
jgi:hypothetical protein